MSEQRFPDLPDNPQQPWVTKLTGADRVGYEEARQHDIDRDVDGIMNRFRSLDDFRDVSDEALSYMALRMAITMRDGYEEGIQVGMEHTARRNAAEHDRLVSFQLNVLGGRG